MIGSNEKKIIDGLLKNKDISDFVKEHKLTYKEIFLNIGKFIYVFENTEYTLAKDNIVRVVLKEKSNDNLKYLFAPQNENLIINISKQQILNENKVNILKKFISNIDERSGMFINGQVGSGKTFTMMQMAKILIDKKKYVSFISFYQYMKFILDNKDRTFIDSILNSNFLFIDDLGAENVSNFYLQELFFVIDYRYRFNLPTTFTSNFTLEELYSKYASVDESQAKRIISRIQDMCINVKL